MEKLLLHTCCAPCSAAVIDELKDKYDLLVYFYNPNIHPIEEYDKRKQELVRLCKEWGVKMIDADYEIEKWDEAILGSENEPEGGARCKKCFYLRLEKVAKFAKDNDFFIFATTLTSGRNKLAAVIHPIAEGLASKYGLKFLTEDWKKDGRQEKGRRIVEDLGIYRQNYCGCRFSQR